jgi:cobalt-zinc-cadmium resistance protein CzcA
MGLYAHCRGAILNKACRIHSSFAHSIGGSLGGDPQVSELPLLTVKLNRQTLSRYGISVGNVHHLHRKLRKKDMP